MGGEEYRIVGNFIHPWAFIWFFFSLNDSESLTNGDGTIDLTGFSDLPDQGNQKQWVIFRSGAPPCICLFVCMSVCMFVCLYVCLPVCQTFFFENLIFYNAYILQINLSNKFLFKFLFKSRLCSVLFCSHIYLDFLQFFKCFVIKLVAVEKVNILCLRRHIQKLISVY